MQSKYKVYSTVLCVVTGYFKHYGHDKDSSLVFLLTEGSKNMK